MLTIPVLVDDPAREAGGASIRSTDSFVRCVYLTVDASEPSSGWNLDRNKQRMPFFMLELSGIVFAPVREEVAPSGEFLTQQDIESTIEFIEARQGLLVETARIYLPLGMVEAVVTNGEPASQDVLRVRQDLFTQARNHATGRTTTREFLRGLDPYDDDDANTRLRYSSQETEAFGHWSVEQMIAIRRHQTDGRKDETQ